GRGGLRPRRHGRAARRQAGPPGPGQAHHSDRRVPACCPGVDVRGSAGRTGRRPVRGPAAPTHRGTGPPAVRAAASASTGRFWPVGEPGQANYEALRQQVLATGTLPDCLAAARFARRGLAGLIAWPAAEPVFRVELVGAARPPWTPYHDPRLDALA